MSERASGVWLAAPALVASVLLLSALGKARMSREDRLLSFGDMSVPKVFERGWIADLHPWAEIVLAVALLALPAPLVVAPAGAVVLLAGAYLWLVVRAVGAEEPAACNCFGDLGTVVVTWRTVVRNVILLVLALIALVDNLAGEGFLARVGEGWPWLIAIGVAVALTYLIVDGHEPSLEASATGVEQRAIPTGLQLVRGDGARLDLGTLAAAKPQLVVFGSLGCGSCRQVAADLPFWQRTLSSVEIRFVVGSDPTELPDWLGDVATDFDPGDAAAQGLGLATSRPSAVLLGANGLTAGDAHGSASVRAFIANVGAHVLTRGG